MANPETMMVECYEDELSPAQCKTYYNRLQSYIFTNMRINNFLKSRKAHLVQRKKTVQIFRFNGKLDSNKDLAHFRVSKLKTLDKNIRCVRKICKIKDRIRSDFLMKKCEEGLIGPAINGVESYVSGTQSLDCDVLDESQSETGNRGLVQKLLGQQRLQILENEQGNLISSASKPVHSNCIQKPPMTSSTNYDASTTKDKENMISLVPIEKLSTRESIGRNNERPKVIDLTVSNHNSTISSHLFEKIQPEKTKETCQRNESIMNLQRRNHSLGSHIQLSRKEKSYILIKKNVLPKISRNMTSNRRHLIITADRVIRPAIAKKMEENFIDKNRPDSQSILKPIHLNLTKNSLPLNGDHRIFMNNHPSTLVISRNQNGDFNTAESIHTPEKEDFRTDLNSCNTGNSNGESSTGSVELLSQSESEFSSKGVKSGESQITTVYCSEESEDDMTSTRNGRDDSNEQCTTIDTNMTNAPCTLRIFNSSNEETNSENGMDCSDEKSKEKRVDSTDVLDQNRTNHSVSHSSVSLIDSGLDSSNKTVHIGQSCSSEDLENIIPIVDDNHDVVIIDDDDDDDENEPTFDPPQNNRIECYSNETHENCIVNIRKTCNSRENQRVLFKSEKCLQNDAKSHVFVSSEMEGICRMMNPKSYKEEIIGLWQKINDLLSAQGSEFIMNLLSLGLIRRQQLCKSPLRHVGISRSMKLIQLEGDHAQDTGFVWTCVNCKESYNCLENTSVFHGSIFEGAELNPSTIVSLIYHWSIQAHIKWVMKKEKLHYGEISKFYNRFRAICTGALHQYVSTKLGGSMKQVQVSFIKLSIGSTFIIIGALETKKNIMSLRVIPCESSNADEEVHTIQQTLTTMVDSYSVIVTDNETLYRKSKYHPFVSRTFIPSAMTNFFNCTVKTLFKEKSLNLELEEVQLFLNELVWRRQCVFSPVRMFNTFLADISAQNFVVRSKTLYIYALDRIASSPFFNWKYSQWRQKCNDSRKTSTDIHSKVSRLQQTIAMRSNGEKVVDVENQTDNLTLDEDPLNGVDKAAESKIAALNDYYCGYNLSTGSHEKREIIELKMNCVICSAAVKDNIDLMKHLIYHAVSRDESSLALKRFTYCLYCFFSIEGNAKEHEASCNLKPKSFTTCLICLAHFNEPDKLVAHLTQNHVESELPYQCKVCAFRVSEYRCIVDHFYEVHRGEKYIQCPFCLEVNDVSDSLMGRKTCVEYYGHIKRHFIIGLNRYCDKCCLNFTADKAFENHKSRDHLSRKYMVKKYQAVWSRMDGTISNIYANKKKEQNLEIRQIVRNYKFSAFDKTMKIVNVPASTRCVECRGPLSATNHFAVHFKCKSCNFSTSCKTAINQHIIYHNYKTDFEKLVLEKEIVLEKALTCECGFTSISGSKLASHLVSCEKTTLYPSGQEALADEHITID